MQRRFIAQIRFYLHYCYDIRFDYRKQALKLIFSLQIKTKHS